MIFLGKINTSAHRISIQHQHTINLMSTFSQFERRTSPFRWRSSSSDASHMILALVRTRKSSWYSSVTLSWARARTNAWSTVARSKSSHRWSACSRSRGPPSVASDGPQRENSRMDFTCKINFYDIRRANFHSISRLWSSSSVTSFLQI